MLPDPLAARLLGEIRRADLVDFRSRLLKRLGGKQNTANKCMGVLKVIFREAVYREDLHTDPTAGLGNIRYQERQPDTFTLPELQLLFPAATLGPWRDLEEHALFLLVAACGLRRGEVLVLRWGQLQIKDGFITVDRAWKGPAGEGTPKSGYARTARIVLFRDRVERRLEEWREHVLLTYRRPIEPTDYVFADYRGEPRGLSWFGKRFRIAMQSFDPSGERHLTPHGLRHSLATLLRAAGKDPVLVRASLGWASEAVQARYEHLRPEDLAALEIE